MSNILVIGGCGFIGFNFMKMLKENLGDRVKIHNFDAMTYAATNYKDSLAYSTFHYGDIANEDHLESLSSLIEGSDYVVNFAAETHVDNSIKDPSKFIRTNILGVQNILDCLRNAKRVQNFVQISTDEVYGSLTTHDKPFTEQSPIKPSSPYSASKASADMLCLAHNHTYKTPITITRCSNNYGLGQHHEKFIPATIRRIVNNEKIIVYGDGRNIRDWINVEDHCLAVKSALFHGYSPNQKTKIFNIGGNNELTNLELVKMIGLELEINSLDLVKFVEDRKGHDFRYAVDFSNIKREFGFQPSKNWKKDFSRIILAYKNKFSQKC